MMAAWRDQVSAWEDFRAQPVEFRELDQQHVLVLTRRSGRGKTSGSELGQLAAKSAQRFTFSEGKVTRLVTYWDGDRALAHLDLAPEGGSQR